MRLIDADVLKLEYPKDEDWDYPVNTNSEVCETIDAQPTVDAEPVRHGEWEVSENGEMCTCSECGAVFDISLGTGCFIDGDELQFPKHCLNCGAKMDGKERQ